MTTAIEIDKIINRVYTDVYMKRRIANFIYETDWQDISQWVISGGLSSLLHSLDSDDFDIGIFKASNINFVFDNSQGKFNDIQDSRSYWSGLDSKNLTKIKVESGYIDDNNDKLIELVFEGFIDERSFQLDANGDTATCLVLSKEYLFQTVTMDGGTLGGSNILASQAIFNLCYRPEITNHITVSLANINPKNDITLDTPNAYARMKLDEILNELMLLTNSIMYIDINGNLIVKNRQQPISLVKTLYLNSLNGSDNIYSINSFNSGRQRVKNYIDWSNTALVSKSIPEFLEKYGVTKKTISSDAITNQTVKQSILDDILSEWQYPKMELEVVTDYLANEIDFYDLVNFDVYPELSRNTNLAIVGSCLVGTAIVSASVTSFQMEYYRGFKVIAYEHDLEASTTKLKLREIGNNLTDGFFEMTNSTYASVSFAAESTKNVDVSAYGFNAQYCKVEVLDSNTSYKTEDFEVTRPSSTIITLTAGVSLTGTFRILITEVTH